MHNQVKIILSPSASWKRTKFLDKASDTLIPMNPEMIVKTACIIASCPYPLAPKARATIMLDIKIREELAKFPLYTSKNPHFSFLSKESITN